MTFCCRFQDVESDSNVELENSEENHTSNNREQNNNNVYQQNLEYHQENGMR